MADLRTTYMGLELKNPIVVGASGLTANIDSIKMLEENGAGAIVIRSLFEEQIQLERFKLEEDLERESGRNAEMVNIYPHIEHGGAEEHLMWTRKARKAVSIPVIASLNAVNRETWVEYAIQLASTGVDGLELNFYAAPMDAQQDGASLEKEQLDILKEVVESVSIPVSVKLSPFYSNPLQVIARMDEAKARGLVLFNRMFQPDIDIKTEKITHPFHFSTSEDNKLSLRFAGLLYGETAADICAATGVHNGEDVIKLLLAGAGCVQVVSTLYKQKASHLQTMLGEIEHWMAQDGYTNLDDFRGKLSQRELRDPFAYTRAQYVKLLFSTEKLLASNRID